MRMKNEREINKKKEMFLYIYVLISSISICNKNRYRNSEKTHSFKRFGQIFEIGQFCGNRSLIKNRRMRQATTIIVFNFIIRDIPC